MNASRRAERNAAARARLMAAAPPCFPPAVLQHACRQTWVPALPRRAVASYWAAHPVRADRLARALADLSGAPEGWVWDGGRTGFRGPPAPFREAAFGRGPGHCCVCGQPVFRLGWHRDLWRDGQPNQRARWHEACVAAWRVWTAPAAQVSLLGKLQRRRCALSGERLTREAEADHRIPLHRLWAGRATAAWPGLLAYWGFPNLQALNPSTHRAKTTAEAGQRAVSRHAGRVLPQALAESVAKTEHPTA